MSSLGYQVVFRLLHDPKRPQVSAERAFLPDDVDGHKQARLPLLTYESGSRVNESPVILFSVAYELEITGLFACLELADIPVLRSERTTAHPLVICGGPLTFSNPLPLWAFADVVVMGEAENVLPVVVETLLQSGLGDAPHDEAQRRALLRSLGQLPGVWVPSEHGEQLPKVAAADDDKLPATSAFLTPHTELSSMFLIEPERGCSRGCTYCVMRRSTNGGMRLVSPERIRSLLPDGITRVGLVGAAVTDHPRLPQILDHVVNERGLQVGISSLRADRLTDEIVGLLAKGGYRTLTVASDGASERMRDKIERRTKARHILRSAELAKQHGMKTLKVYMMVGLPDETDEDIDELVGFAKEISKVIRLAYGIAPFVAKRNTPLDGAHSQAFPKSSVACSGSSKVSKAAPKCVRPLRAGPGLNICSRKVEPTLDFAPMPHTWPVVHLPHGVVHSTALRPITHRPSIDSRTCPLISGCACHCSRPLSDETQDLTRRSQSFRVVFRHQLEVARAR